MSKEFYDLMFRQTPVFDALLLEGRKPMDLSYISTTGSFGEMLYQGYVKSVEAVRRIVEGLAYQAGGVQPYVAKEWEYDFMSKMGFNAPVLQGEWMEVGPEDIGEPCG